MKKIWDYVSIRAKRALSVRQVMTYTVLSVGTFHVGLLLLFFYFKIYPMVFVNMLSIILYMTCYKDVRWGRNLLHVFNLMYGEILIHAVIAALLLGTESGFTLYLVAMLPIGYYASYNFNTKKRRINPMLYVITAFVAFVFVRVAAFYIEPMYSYGDKLIDKSIYMVNYLLVVIAIVAFFSTLLNQIRLLEKTRATQNERLELLSKIDPLTGLMNRRCIQERYKQAEELKEDYALILGDIDDFKKINDTYGHDVGDEVLKAVAGVFKGMVYGEGMVCRWGGEEILVFLPKHDKDEAVTIAWKILENIRQLEIKTNGEQMCHITLTLGVSDSDEADTFEKTLRLADERLYNGKHSGKNRVIHF